MNKEVKKRLLWLSEHKTEDVKEDIIYTLDYIRELEREIERLKAIVEGTKENRNELQEEIKRLKEEYMILQNASDEVEEEKDEEIERQKEIIRQLDIKNLELTTIIKEVREYIEKNLAKDDNGCGCWWYSFEYYVNAKKELLEMLDKVGDEV